MATKIYLPSTGSPDVTPSTWNHANQAASTYTLKGVLAKISSAFSARRTATGTTSPYTRAVMRYIIGPLSAQTIAGTINVVMRCYESNAGANATMSCAVKIIQPNGSDRAVLLAATASDAAGGAQEFTTTLSTRRAYDVSENRPITLTSQDAQSGDYLVIELGFRSATTTTRNVDMEQGDNSGSDCVDTDGDTNQYCPWASFSQTLSWLQTLVVQEVMHGHTTDAIALTEHKTLSVNGADHAQEAEGPLTLVEEKTLAVNGADHAQTAEEPVLVEEAGAIELTVSECLHGLSSDPVALTQVHSLAVAGCDHALSSDPFALTQAHTLAVAETLHSLSTDALALTQDYLLAVAESAHGLSSDSPLLTQAHILAVAEAAHSQTTDAIALSQAHQLAVAGSDHGLSSDPIALSQAHTLAVAGADHPLSSDPLSLTQAHILVVAGCDHPLASDPILLDVSSMLDVQEASHGHNADNVGLTQIHNLDVDKAEHALASDPVSLSQAHSLAVAETLHGHSVDNIDLIYVSPDTLLVVQEGLHALASDSPALSQVHHLVLSEALHQFISDIPVLSQVQTLAMSNAWHSHSADSLVLDAGAKVGVDPEFWASNRRFGRRLTRLVRMPGDKRKVNVNAGGHR